MNKTSPILLALFLVLAGCSEKASAQNWPQFRGPYQTGVVDQFEIPTSWSIEKNLAWKVPSPGQGWSSPIVWEDKVFVSCSRLKGEDFSDSQDRSKRDRISVLNEYELAIHCYDLNSGQELWSQVAFSGQPLIPTHRRSTYANETPVTDGERVFVYFGPMGLYCYDLDGNLLWKKDLGVYPMEKDWGTGSSPVIHDDLVYLQIDNEENSFVVALDTESGEERFHIPREEGSNWSNPMIWQNKLRTELVTQGSMVRSYDSKSGELLWTLKQSGGRNNSTPSGNEDLLFVGNEKRGGGGVLYAVKAGATGDITPADGEFSSSGVAWSNPNGGIAMASPLVYQGYVYAFERESSRVNCYVAETGEVAYYRKPIPDSGDFWSSPWGYDGKVYCVDGNGLTHVLAAGEEFNLLGQFPLNDQIWATPAITPGSIVFRGVNNIYCVRN
ncbi:MAG: PQQ-binding-like beta-propeller repeat protein [Verrucomicrobia bacterium]|nr:PQQ-binding-like beta-propeller repeat protein [Verrucomicrobiota bacterium]